MMEAAEDPVQHASVAAGGALGAMARGGPAVVANGKQVQRVPAGKQAARGPRA